MIAIYSNANSTITDTAAVPTSQKSILEVGENIIASIENIPITIAIITSMAARDNDVSKLLVRGFVISPTVIVIV